MINLNEEEQIQLIKLRSIFALHLKYGVIILIMNLIANEITTFQEVTLSITITMLIFNCIAAVFLLCFKREFPKTEYFLIYTMNIFIFLIQMVYSLNYFVEQKQKNQKLQIYIKTYIMIIIEKEISILIIKIFQLDVAHKFVNSFTQFIIVLMILSNDDNQECIENQQQQLLFLLLSTTITIVFNIVFNLLQMIQLNGKQKETRNFSNLILFVLFLANIAQYIFILFKTISIQQQDCPCLQFIFEYFKYEQPIHFISFCYIIYQEIIYFRDTLKYDEMIEKSMHRNNSYAIQRTNKNDRLSLKSLSSVINNPMEPSECNSQAPNFGNDKKNQKLQKLGTSQFGVQQGMIHSFANVQNQTNYTQQKSQNIFVQQESSNNQKRESKSIDESFIRQEESQIPENLSQLQNPMDSGSDLVK